MLHTGEPFQREAVLEDIVLPEMRTRQDEIKVVQKRKTSHQHVADKNKGVGIS
jgi:hypothetical protein